MPSPRTPRTLASWSTPPRCRRWPRASPTRIRASSTCASTTIDTSRSKGAGAISTWRLDLQQADNALDLAQVADVVLTLAYTARSGGAALEAVARADRDKGLARGGHQTRTAAALQPQARCSRSVEAARGGAGGTGSRSALPLEADQFSGRYRGLDLRIERVTVFARARAALGADALKLRLDPPKGSGSPITGWVPPWPRSRTLRATAEVSGPPGAWKLAASASGRRCRSWSTIWCSCSSCGHARAEGDLSCWRASSGSGVRRWIPAWQKSPNQGLPAPLGSSVGADHGAECLNPLRSTRRTSSSSSATLDSPWSWFPPTRSTPSIRPWASSSGESTRTWRWGLSTSPT